MFRDVFSQELRRDLRGLSFFLFIGILFVATLASVLNTDPNNVIVIPIGSEWHNSPLVIARMFAFLSVVGILFSLILVGRSTAKDFDTGIFEFFFTAPIGKTAYLGGRLFAGLTANLLIYVGVVIGFFVGCAAIDPKFSGPFTFSAFFWPIVVILIPNLYLIGSLFFALSTLTRKMANAYLAGVALFVVYGGISIGFTFLKNHTFRVLADPFGISSLWVFTETWTVSDINLNPMPINALVVLNRLIWIGVGSGLLAWTWKKFRFVSLKERKQRKLPSLRAPRDRGGVESAFRLQETVVDHSFIFRVRQCLHLVRRDFARIVRSPGFLILTAFAVLNVIANFLGDSDAFGNRSYPLTSVFLQHAKLMWVYAIPLTIVFGGMLVWSERDNRSHSFYNTYPLPGWMGFGSKLLTLISMQTFYVVALMAGGIFTQVVLRGWTGIEAGLYIRTLFGVNLIQYAHIALVVLTIQNLAGNKTLGFFLCAGYFLADLFIFQVGGFDVPLLRYGRVPDFIYSNLNGFGHYGTIIVWYTVYWLLFAGILLVLNSLLWRRHEETALRFRLRVARQNFKRVHAGALGALFLLWTSVGGYLFINRYVLNPYLSKSGMDRMHARYEKKYKSYLKLPQPEMRHVELKVDFFPEERNVLIEGSYLLKNASDRPIPAIYVNLSDRKITGVRRLEFDRPSKLTYRGEEFGFRIFVLEKPLAPGETVRLGFSLEALTRGFSDNNPRNELARNGCRLHLSAWEANEYFPTIGYMRTYELVSKRERRKYGLPETPLLPALEEADRSYNPMGVSFITYNAVLSTCSSQTAITNSDLVGQWTEGGRNFYHYRSQQPMENEIVLLSGKYEVKKTGYKGKSLEVFYDRRHPWNVDRILQGIRSSLDYCSENFFPYPFQAVRVVEVSDYLGSGGARAQPSLIIWKESAGFITDLRAEKAVDVLFVGTAHELAHNWWPVILVPAWTEGIGMMSEAIAQYVSVMCLEKEYGQGMTRRLLKEEMGRYLSRRKNEQEGERPLLRSYPWQLYLTYEKSLIAMYALQDAVGKERVNAALHKIMEEYAYIRNGFPSPLDLMQALRDVTSPELQYVLTDLFEAITLHDNRAVSASCEPLDNGTYKVNLKVSCRKFRSDAWGKETEIPIRDYMAVGILGEKGEEIYFKKHLIDRPEMDIEVVVDRLPQRAGIDPFLVLIDKNRDDNLVTVRRER
jgi:hypothetical protein